MTSAAFLADFNARFACSLHLRGGHEFDQTGASHTTGSACATCCGCESRSGDMGVADSGFALERQQGRLRLSWACPSCGTTVTEDTSLLGACADAKTIAGDALCHRCRTKKTFIHDKDEKTCRN